MATKASEISKANDLFGDVELENARQRITRTKVDVPAGVLKVLKEAQTAGQRAIYPVRDKNHYDAMADVFWSAGDLLQASVNSAPVVKVDGAWKVVKLDWNATDSPAPTHVRVTVGKRRGRKVTGDSDAK